MRFVIIGNDGKIIPNSSIDAIDANDARDMAMDIVPSGQFTDVASVNSKEYQNAVQARGKVESEQMNKNIKMAREGQMERDGGVSPYVAPYTREAELAGREPGMVEGAKDFFSLPGRFIATAGESDFESMKVPSEKREGTIEQIVTSPATGVGVALTPLAMMAGGGIGASQLLANSPRLAPWLVGAGEGATIGAGTSAFRGMTEEEYGIADAAAETILSSLLGSGLKFGSDKFASVAKNMISKAGKFTDDQIKYLYSKLGITKGGTEKNLATEVEQNLSNIGDISYKYQTKMPTTEDNLPKSVRDILTKEHKKGIQIGNEPAMDINNVIPDEVAYSYEQNIKTAMMDRKITPAQAKEKLNVLNEYKQWSDELKRLNIENEPVELSKIIQDAKYFYSRDPELGKIILDNINAQYKMNYAMMMSDPSIADNVTLEPLSDLSSKFGKALTASEYANNLPTPQAVFKNGGVMGLGSIIPDVTPERAKLLSSSLEALRMPSTVAVQDVVNLNQMRSK